MVDEQNDPPEINLASFYEGEGNVSEEKASSKWP